jgi:hypothetical protein
MSALSRLTSIVVKILSKAVYFNILIIINEIFNCIDPTASLFSQTVGYRISREGGIWQARENDNLMGSGLTRATKKGTRAPEADAIFIF